MDDCRFSILPQALVLRCWGQPIRVIEEASPTESTMRSKLVDDVLASFDGLDEKFQPHAVSGALYALATNPRLTDEDRRRLSFELAAWDLQAGHQKSSIWDTHFYPLHVGQAEDGSPIYRPDLADLGADAAMCWSDNLTYFKSPFLRARYADLLWDLAYLHREDKKRDCASARTAVESYLDVAKRSGDIEAAFALERAFQIATELNDAMLVDAVSERLLSLARSAELAAIGVWSMPSRCFLDYRKLLESRRTEWILDLERRMTEAAAAANGFACEVVVDTLRKVYKGDAGKEDRHRILRMLSAAYEAQAKDPKVSAGVAITWFQNIVARLDSEELLEDADRLRLSIEQLGLAHLREMQTVSVEASIDRKEVEETIENLIAVDHPFLALFRLAANLSPRCDALRTQVREHEKEFIFYSLFPRTIVGRDGLPKASIGSSEDDMDGRMVEEATQVLSLFPYFFRLGYEKAKERFQFKPAELVAVIAQSYLCSAEIEGSVLEGVRAYDNKDYFKAINGLIPQIEGMLRELLRLLSIPVRKRTGRRSEFSDLKNMSDILDERGVIDALEEDLLFFIRIVFVDRRGWNLRNEFAHGLLPAGAFNEGTASAVIMVLFLLAIIGPHGVYVSSEALAEEGAA